MGMTFGSLFSGTGGLDLGLERAGMQCKWQVENDEYCRRVLEKHWPDVQRYKDVHTFPPQEGCAEVDLICGGDPCQANSAAGNSSQQSLGGEFIRIVDELRPRFVLRENPSHVRKDAPWPWWKFRSELESLGYAVLPFRLRACCVGAFHQRERVFLLAELANTNGDRLERREASHQNGDTKEPARPMDAEVWESLYACRGFGSRAGLPSYVDRIRGLGNAVVPAVGQFIGERILKACNGNTR